ncbi:MAG: hypothetical protein HFG64_14030 [Lachnospiraceae bacterium]|nr:hypothetical protein [Lachnospiraceae bacterium]
MKYPEYVRTYGRRAGLVILAVMLGACLTTGCKKKEPEKIDISSIHTSAAETMPEETTKAEPTEKADSSTEAADSTGSQNVRNVSTKMNTYSSGKVSIEYPSVVNLDDQEQTTAVDNLIKNNALSIIQAYGLNEAEDSLNIKCRVLSADRNRITITYTGEVTRKDASSPTAVFYSNTIDVKEAKDLGFEKFADPYTMAGYVLSGDCHFVSASSDLNAELMKYKNENSLDYYTKLFNNADFPFEGTFPESFSYEQDGDIYFSIPVPHALGDYALVVYVPDSK